jgi:hypothetical protein
MKKKYLFVVDEYLHVHSDNEKSLTIQQGDLSDGGRPDNLIFLDRDDALNLRDALTAWLMAGEPPAKDNENKVAVLEGDGDPPSIIFAMSQAAWDYIKDGKTHTFDLTRAGFPMQVLIAGGPTRASVLEDIKRAILAKGGSFDDGTRPDRDLGIQEPTKQ